MPLTTESNVKGYQPLAIIIHVLSQFFSGKYSSLELVMRVIICGLDIGQNQEICIFVICG